VLPEGLAPNLVGWCRQREKIDWQEHRKFDRADDFYFLLSLANFHKTLASGQGIKFCPTFTRVTKVFLGNHYFCTSMFSMENQLRFQNAPVGIPVSVFSFFFSHAPNGAKPQKGQQKTQAQGKQEKEEEEEASKKLICNQGGAGSRTRLHCH